MFAYCLNNPVAMKDEKGNLGVLALCGIGALIGGLVNYAGQVIANYNNGKSGAEAWTDVDVGNIAAAAFSGAVSAIPGIGIYGDVIDAVGSNVISHGVNALVSGDAIEMSELGYDIASDLVSSIFIPDVVPSMELPKYIRDIKKEAREAGIKGTRKLQAYLDFKQVGIILINTFNSDTSDRLEDASLSYIGR